MKKRLTYLLFYLAIHLSSVAQLNLVPNPSFEDTINNNCWVQMLISNSLVASGFYTKNWGTYQFQSPDYYNICANSSTFVPYPNAASIPHNCQGYQEPRTDNAYSGIVLYEPIFLPDTTHINSELLVVKLKQPLKTNTCYYGEFYMSFSNINTFSINQLGMLFTKTDLTNSPYTVDNNLPYQIQWDTTQYFTDTLNWVKMSGKFIAQGGEEYLTIGNFRDGTHLKKTIINNSACLWSRITYILIDDISLYELPTPQLGLLNYTICPTSDSLLLGDTLGKKPLTNGLQMGYQ